LGSLDDDLEESRLILNRAEDEPIYLWHDIEHISGLLRLIAYLDLP
jgi:hypothetical protein